MCFTRCCNPNTLESSTNTWPTYHLGPSSHLHLGGVSFCSFSSAAGMHPFGARPRARWPWPHRRHRCRWCDRSCQGFHSCPSWNCCSCFAGAVSVPRPWLAWRHCARNLPTDCHCWTAAMTKIPHWSSCDLSLRTRLSTPVHRTDYCLECLSVMGEMIVQCISCEVFIISLKVIYRSINHYWSIPVLSL